MAVALKVYSKQTEDANPDALRPLHRYGLAGLPYELLQTLSEPLPGTSLESLRSDLYSSLLETRLESNATALTEPIVVSFSEVPTGTSSFAASPIQGNYLISYIRGHESINWYSGEEQGNFVWPFRLIVVGSDHLPLEIEQRLRHLASLQPNWDSYGASPVGRVALGKTRTLLLRLYSLNLPSLPAAFIAPDPEGGIGIEWDFGLGREVLLTISAEGHLTYVLDMGRKRGEQEQLSANDLNDIEQILTVAAR